LLSLLYCELYIGNSSVQFIYAFIKNTGTGSDGRSPFLNCTASDATFWVHKTTINVSQLPLNVKSWSVLHLK